MAPPPACHKVRHADEAAAIRHLKDRKRHTRENKKLANKLNIYWCWQCEAWHLGHNRLKGKQYPSRGEMHNPEQIVSSATNVALSKDAPH